MSAANKILTVSYGTFSCTIEGFEDPFGTMKQIAEYFRDLAAEDRYFGAEPPVPDAEALRHIAERETTRRVEARMASGAVHLRRIDDAAAASAATPVVPAVAPSPEAAAALTPSEVIDPTPSSAPSSVAERLSRIRAVVARARTQPIWPEEEAVAEAVTETGAEIDAATETFTVSTGRDAAAPGPAVASADPQSPAAEPEHASGDGHMRGAAAIEAAGSSVAATTVTDTIAGDTVDVDGTALDYVVEMRGSAAASDERSDIDAAAHAPLATDWAEPSVADADIVDENAAPAEVAADVAVVASAVSRTDADPVGNHDDATPGDAADGDATSKDELRGTVSAVTEWALPPDAAPDYLRPELPVARVAVLRRDDHAAAAATGHLEDLLTGKIAAEDLYDEDKTAEAPVALTDADDRLLHAIRAADTASHDAGERDGSDAAVVARAMSDAAPEAWAGDTAEMVADPGIAGESSAHATEEDVTSAVADAPDTGIAGPLHLDTDWRANDVRDETVIAARSTAEDAPAAADRNDFLDLEADEGAPLLLQASEDAGPPVTPDAEALGAEDDRSARAGHEQAVEDLERIPEDASVDRLLAATNSQLDSTEVNRRRSAIAHLKAAVAAARADRRPEDDTAEPTADPGASAIDKFREDLARVVRPRRPVDQDQPRPSRRLPPLMLVSEQRIDAGTAEIRNEDAMAGPVRPRRVITRDVGDDDLAADVADPQSGFADFAESMGVRDLPDMIEAAAAYSAFVEGRPSFSRPQLMQMMRAGDAIDDSFSREEQLRSFGLLLRQGRIQKLKRGQFTVADDTRFRPPHRHAGE